MPAGTRDGNREERRRLVVEGAVQGVGFRPFVYRLAVALGLSGGVRNTGAGVLIEVQGAPAALEAFQHTLANEPPALARITALTATRLSPEPGAPTPFRILPSEAGHPRPALLPDVALCDECRRELLDPADRRHRYPFINCTHCGPRYSVAEVLPFDRDHTTMRSFTPCAACRAEYADPAQRRFHAQLIACPACGPRLALWDGDGRTLGDGEEALRQAVRALDDGRILALKGIGGFQLLVLAGRASAVERLRRRKGRESKPFAVMVPDLDGAAALCRLDAAARALLASPEAPIVLLRRHPVDDGDTSAIAPAVAPGNPNLGVMLPYSPLHLLLMQAVGAPVVATSGNRSEEPICTDEYDALARLGDIADLFLVHDRRIARHVDDSVARVIMGREMVIRRARGYVPLPIRLPHDPGPILAVGGHLKSTVALTVGADAILSQHIGDLDTPHGVDMFQGVVADLERLYAQPPRRLSRDLHPDYRSTHYADARPLPAVAVQHHVAHLLACLADNACEAPCLGVCWDGTGFGSDGTVWGGEWFLLRGDRVRRVGRLRPFRLPGGERAVREPARAALGVLYAIYGDDVFKMEDLAPVRELPAAERRVLATMLARGLNAPETSSVGRLFDAVAALIGDHRTARYEGEAAMALEYAAQSAPPEAFATGARLLPIVSAGGPAAFGDPPFVCADWSPLVTALLSARAQGVAFAVLAARFHQALVDAMVDMARHVGEQYVVLSGGCFQNALLLERGIAHLRAAGFTPLWHRRVPPNDGGLALGQIVAAARHIELE